MDDLDAYIKAGHHEPYFFGFNGLELDDYMHNPYQFSKKTDRSDMVATSRLTAWLICESLIKTHTQ